MKKIVGLGGVTVDEIGVVERFPRVEEVEYIQQYRQQQGGMIATALVAAARLGCPAEFIGGVGDDDYGRYALEVFRREGVETRRAVIFPGQTTAFSFVIVERDSGKRTIFHHRGVQESDVLVGEPTELDDGVGCLHLDRYWIATALDAARRAREQGIPVTLDPGQYRDDPRIRQLIGLTDYLIPSAAFARRFTGREDTELAARELLGLGPRAVVVTLGDQGAFTASSDGQRFSTPPFRVPVVDTTGAGDSFHGGFAFALIRGCPLEKSVIFASAVAALKCTKLGGQSGLPGFDEVSTFLAGHQIKLD